MKKFLLVIIPMIALIAACDKKGGSAVKLPGAKPSTTTPGASGGSGGGRTTPTLVNDLDGTWGSDQCVFDSSVDGYTRTEFKLQGTNLEVYTGYYSTESCAKDDRFGQSESTSYLVGVYKDAADSSGGNVIMSFPEENVEIKVRKLVWSSILLDNTYRYDIIQ